jgi:ABC-type nitrate/sulfonate/bicarbonate transport system substrate-binding protein
MKLFMLTAVLFLAGLGTAAQAQPAPAPALRTVNVITFGGGVNLPIFVAQRQGFFAKHGVEINLRYTPSSVYLMTGLIESRFDIASAAIDSSPTRRGRARRRRK